MRSFIDNPFHRCMVVPLATEEHKSNFFFFSFLFFLPLFLVYSRSQDNKMNRVPTSTADSEESLLQYESTAPTTPDGSLTFSPVLQAIRAMDTVEVDAMASLSVSQQNSGRNTRGVREADIRPIQIRNVCCVGAGYVGMSTPLFTTKL